MVAIPSINVTLAIVLQFSLVYILFAFYVYYSQLHLGIHHIQHIHLFSFPRPRTRADEFIYSAGYAGYHLTPSTAALDLLFHLYLSDIQAIRVSIALLF